MQAQLVERSVSVPSNQLLKISQDCPGGTESEALTGIFQGILSRLGAKCTAKLVIRARLHSRRSQETKRIKEFARNKPSDRQRYHSTKSDRGCEFEFRRPRHSFQESCTNFSKNQRECKKTQICTLLCPYHPLTTLPFWFPLYPGARKKGALVIAHDSPRHVTRSI